MLSFRTYFNRTNFETLCTFFFIVRFFGTQFFFRINFLLFAVIFFIFNRVGKSSRRQDLPTSKTRTCSPVRNSLSGRNTSWRMSELQKSARAKRRPESERTGVRRMWAGRKRTTFLSVATSTTPRLDISRGASLSRATLSSFDVRQRVTRARRTSTRYNFFFNKKMNNEHLVWKKFLNFTLYRIIGHRVSRLPNFY